MNSCGWLGPTTKPAYSSETRMPTKRSTFTATRSSFAQWSGSDSYHSHWRERERWGTQEPWYRNPQTRGGGPVSSSRLNRARLDRELACRGWTATDLAAASGISPATISAARRGRALNHKTLQRIADALIT